MNFCGGKNSKKPDNNICVRQQNKWFGARVPCLHLLGWGLRNVKENNFRKSPDAKFTSFRHCQTAFVVGQNTTLVSLEVLLMN